MEIFKVEMNYTKPNKFNLGIIIFSCISLIILGLVKEGYPIVGYILLVSGILMGSLVYFLKAVPQFVKSIILPLIPLLLVTFFTIRLGFLTNPIN